MLKYRTRSPFRWYSLTTWKVPSFRTNFVPRGNTGTPLSFEEVVGSWEEGKVEEPTGAQNATNRPSMEISQHNAGCLRAFIATRDGAPQQISHALSSIQNSAGADIAASGLGMQKDD
jgi:hypothetical protein